MSNLPFRLWNIIPATLINSPKSYVVLYPTFTTATLSLSRKFKRTQFVYHKERKKNTKEFIWKSNVRQSNNKEKHKQTHGAKKGHFFLRSFPIHFGKYICYTIVAATWVSTFLPSLDTHHATNKFPLRHRRRMQWHYGVLGLAKVK